MTEVDVNDLLDRLLPSFETEAGDWSEVLSRASLPTTAPSHTGQGRRTRLRIRSRRLAIFVPLVAAIAASLAITTPWQGGPTILERAAAAIPDPTSSQILYEDVVVYPGVSAPSRAAVIDLRLWLDGAAPHRFRVTFSNPASAGGSPQSRLIDVAGTLGNNTQGFSYNATYDALDPVSLTVGANNLNPAAYLRAALKAGQAHLDGKTTIAGRAVIRIRVTAHLDGQLVGTALYYVDAHTYQPVRVTVRAVAPNAAPGVFPMTTLQQLPYGSFSGAEMPFVYTYDFTQFKYLPPTANNRKLTNIHAEHANAKVA